MLKNKSEPHWDFYAVTILVSFSVLQIVHWPLLPLFMDIYYHLHTAWGFIQAGGYSGWDFWQYAPVGRPHIYPPFFHIILAFLLKLGINKIILAKCLEMVMPILFLNTLWFFIRRHFGERLAALVLVMLSSSFSAYLSLINHLPATLALVFGILAIDQLFNGKLWRSALLLALGFYTHIAVSWFFAIALILLALFDARNRKLGFKIVLIALVLSLPILLRQLAVLRFVLSFDLREKYFCEFKTIDYLLALAGAGICWRLKGKYLLFLSLFLAGFLFLTHPYRFFSAEGFFPIVFLSAVSLNQVYENSKKQKVWVRSLPPAIIIFVLLFSPTLLMEKQEGADRISFKIYTFDSVLVDMLFPEHNKRITSSTLWYPKEYLWAVNLIQQNSTNHEIIYTTLPNVGVALAALSERATANALLPDIAPARLTNPLLAAKIIILLKDDNLDKTLELINKNHLVKIGENKIFMLYLNPVAAANMEVKRAAVPFWIILLIGTAAVFLFWRHRSVECKAKSAKLDTRGAIPNK